MYESCYFFFYWICLIDERGRFKGGLFYYIYRFFWGCIWSGGRFGGWGGWVIGVEGGLWSSDFYGLIGVVFGLRRVVYRRWSAVRSGFGYVYLWFVIYMVVVFLIFVLVEGFVVSCYIIIIVCFIGFFIIVLVIL